MHGRGGRHRGFRHGRHGIFGSMGGGDDFARGRKLDAEDLHLVILAFLAKGPAHGYELMKTIEEHSGGFYTPSPGVIYPALSYLAELGHASVEPEGARKRYTITDEGRAYLASRQAEADTILTGLSRAGARMEDVRDAFAGMSEVDGGASDELHRARHAIKDALRQKRGCDLAEAKRIAQILKRAAAEILSA
jgi:DNA-binding PadR family transcriptional regulator